MLDAGVRVGLGTDSVASNNRCDMLDEARFCCLVHRAARRDFNWPTAERALRLMTLDGARAFGLESEIGSLEVNKQADLIVINLARTHNTPVHDPTAAIIFSAASSDVLLTMVAGRVLFDGQRVHTLDEAEIADRVALALNKMRSCLISISSTRVSFPLPISGRDAGQSRLCTRLRAGCVIIYGSLYPKAVTAITTISAIELSQLKERNDNSGTNRYGLPYEG